MKINEFLLCKTPDSWVAAAADNWQLLLLDHGNCEKKAASTALTLMYRYVDKPDMMIQLSKLAREELRHFEQVLALMGQRGIQSVHVSPSRYAAELRKHVRTHEPARLIDILIVSAIVEARSCERFGRLIGVLDETLSCFYESLLKSEARHFNVYLNLAQGLGHNLDERIGFFLQQERALIESPDPEFRFHSGMPCMGEA